MLTNSLFNSPFREKNSTFRPFLTDVETLSLEDGVVFSSSKQKQRSHLQVVSYMNIRFNPTSWQTQNSQEVKDLRLCTNTHGPFTSSPCVSVLERDFWTDIE